MRAIRARLQYAVAVTKGAARRLRAAIAPRATMAYLIALALIQRPLAEIRRRRSVRPRLIWGPVPIISLKYWSEAMRKAGYESRTCVLTHYAINRREDFDVHLDEFAGDDASSRQRAPYRFFAWALRHGDVFFRFFDGGFLRHTPFEWWEGRLLKLAGKRLIVSPYGSDVAVSGHLDGLEGALYADYPALREHSDGIERWVEHTAKWADLVVRNWQLGYLPRHDVVWLNQLAIDLDQWAPAPAGSGSARDAGEVTVLHTPNHRHIKGTEHLERAVRELREEGLAVRLELLQGRPNEEVRAAVQAADVIADQFLLPGYAMAAVEAMAAGKPVMDNLSGLPAELRSTEAFERCPAVDTNPERLKDDLRRLVEDPGLRRELGRAGREFVERFHSYEVVAASWDRIIEHVWRGAPLPESLLPRPADQEAVKPAFPPGR
jgi:glycosyltransferase involved in cell wall biosynthesis